MATRARARQAPGFDFGEALAEFFGKPSDPLLQEPQAAPAASEDSAILDSLLGFGKGLAIDTPMGMAQIAANTVQATVPFVDLKAIGEKLTGKAAPESSAFAAFIDRLNPKPSAEGGFGALDLLSLGATNREMAKRLNAAEAPTDIAPIFTLLDVIGVQPLIEGALGRQLITGQELTPEERGRTIAGALVPATVTGSLIGGAVKQVLGKGGRVKGTPDFMPPVDRAAGLVEQPRARLVTRADIAKRGGVAAAEQLANDPRLELTPETVDAVASALEQSVSDTVGVGERPPSAGALGMEPDFTKVLTPESLRESIYGAREDILAALRELPPSKQALQISDQIADILRAKPGLPEARIVQLAEDMGVDRQTIVDRLMLAQNEIADNIVGVRDAEGRPTGGAAAGGFLHELSDVQRTIDAMQRTSPDVRDRMIAANRRLEHKRGFMDILNDTLIRPGLASAVSGFGNAMRDMMVQTGISQWQIAFEHTMEGMATNAAHGIENWRRRASGQTERARTPDMADIADGWHELHAGWQHLAQLPDRIGKQLSAEGMEWSRNALAADLRGEARPALPESLRNEPNFLWESIIDTVPAGMSRILGDQLADINTQGVRAETARLFVQKLQEAQIPGRAARSLTDASRLLGDMWSNAVTLHRRVIDLEQRKAFFAQRMAAHGMRNGVDVTTVEGLRQLNDLMNQTADERPMWLDNAYDDAADFSLKSTFSADPEYSLLRKYLQIHQSLPILNWAGLKFPRFMSNKLAFIADRQPLQLMSIFKPEFIRSLSGVVDEAQLLDEVVQVTPEAKKLWNRAERLTTDEGVRQEARGEAMKLPQGAEREAALEQARTLTAPGEARRLQQAAREIASGREDFSVLHEKAVQRIQSRTAKQFSRGLSGAVMLMTMMQLRNSGYAGARYNELDFGPVNPELPEGERRTFDIRNWAPASDYAALATVLDSVLKGQDPLANIGADDLVEVVSGIRRINEETILAVGDIVRAMGQGQPNYELAGEAAATLAGSNIAMFTGFFRNLKDVESIYDVSEEAKTLQDTKNAMPLFGQAVANLPLFMQGRARELITGGDQTGPLPPAINPFANKPLYQSNPGSRLFFGFNVREVSGMNRIMNKSGLTQRALIGRSGSDELDQIMGKRIGWLLGQPVDDGGRTLGDVFVAITQTEAQAKAGAGFDYRLALKDAMLRNFETIRGMAQPLAISDYAQYDPAGLQEILATRGADSSTKKFIRELLKKVKDDAENQQRNAGGVN